MKKKSRSDLFLSQFSLLLHTDKKGLVGKSEEEHPKPQITAGRFFGEIEGVERAAQEGRGEVGAAVGVCGIPFEAQFQGGSFKLIDCEVVFPSNLPIAA
jgi:hypothetical protein